MQLSLSGRIIEVAYRSCEVSVPEFLRLARECGYDAVELRATQLPVGTTRAEAEQIRRLADDLGLGISCCMPPGVTADEAGLQRVDQFVTVARRLECATLKVWIGEVSWLQRACDRIAPHGMTLLHQTHTGGPFETIASCVETVAEVGRANFGLQYDPANLFEAGEEYGEAAVRGLGTAIRQLSVQSIRRGRPEEPGAWEHEGHYYQRCGLGEAGAVDYGSVFRGLRAIGFDGAVTVNEPKPAGMETWAWARRRSVELRSLMSAHGGV